MTELTPAQRDLLDRIAPTLGEVFGERVLIASDQPSLFVRLGSVGVLLDVADAPGGDAVLECYAWVARELPITPELGLYLAQCNVELHFGALAIDGDGAIMLRVVRRVRLGQRARPAHPRTRGHGRRARRGSPRPLRLAPFSAGGKG